MTTALTVTILLFVATVHVKAERPTTCPDGFQQHGHSCYAVFGQNVTWIAAQSYCTTFGSDMLRIDSQQESSAVNMMVQRIHVAATNRPIHNYWPSYWLDANDLLTEGVWRYSGRHGDKLQYTNWASGSPNSATATEDCAVLHSHSQHWDDVDCVTNLANVICEIQLRQDSTVIG